MYTRVTVNRQKRKGMRLIRRGSYTGPGKREMINCPKKK
jgi:hypothetical protein